MRTLGCAGFIRHPACAKDITMTLPPLRLNPSLKPEDYIEAYTRDRFVQIPDIFEPELAHALATMLRTQIPWRLVYQTPQDGVVQISPEDAQSLGREVIAQRMQLVMQLAEKNYGFCYNSYQMIEAVIQGRDPGHPIHEVTQFLNSRAFLDFGSAIIGEAGITKADAQATLFGRGGFLTRHVDEGANRERRAAYTLGFSQNWQTDWGGLLMLIDKQTTDVRSAYIPRFNTLTLFDGMAVHSVSPVSAFAGDGRYSIVGWLRNDPVPT